MKSLNDLVAFNRALDLVVCIYDVTADFPPQERYGLTSQLRRAAVGVASQIAEGQGRLSYGEWRQFLSQARGSLYEVDAECRIAERLGFLHEEKHRQVQVFLRSTGKALGGLLDWVQRQERAVKKPGNSATQQLRNRKSNPTVRTYTPPDAP